MGCRLLSESLRDKSIMVNFWGATEYISNTIKVTQDNHVMKKLRNIRFPCWICATEGT